LDMQKMRFVAFGVSLLIKNKMTKKAYIITGIGVVVGLLAGYLYYQEIGCLSGTCAITSKPLNSTLYGGLMGGLLFNLVSDFFEKRKKN